MKFLILSLISILSVASISAVSRYQMRTGNGLVLRQEVQLLQNNAFKNILREQNLSKRSRILDEALAEIQKLREQNPLQLKKDETAISKIVQNLKSMSSNNQAHYKEGQ